jgi:hypothetical protein
MVAMGSVTSTSCITGAFEVLYWRDTNDEYPKLNTASSSSKRNMKTDKPRAGAPYSDPDTSMAAAREIEPHLGRLEAIVLREIE